VMWLDQGSKAAEEGQDEIDARVKEQLPGYEVEAQQQKISDKAGQIEGSINDAVLQGNLAFDQDAGSVDNTGSRYDQLSAHNTLNNERDAVALAKRYAAITAPNLVNMRDTVQREDAGVDIQAAMDAINRKTGIAGNAASLVNVTANPWLKMGGQALAMYGGAAMGSGANSATVTTSQASPWVNAGTTTAQMSPAATTALHAGTSMPTNSWSWAAR